MENKNEEIITKEELGNNAVLLQSIANYCDELVLSRKKKKAVLDKICDCFTGIGMIIVLIGVVAGCVTACKYSGKSDERNRAYSRYCNTIVYNVASSSGISVECNNPSFHYNFDDNEHYYVSETAWVLKNNTLSDYFFLAKQDKKGKLTAEYSFRYLNSEGKVTYSSSMSLVLESSFIESGGELIVPELVIPRDLFEMKSIAFAIKCISSEKDATIEESYTTFSLHHRLK